MVAVKFRSLVMIKTSIWDLKPAQDFLSDSLAVNRRRIFGFQG